MWIKFKNIIKKLYYGTWLNFLVAYFQMKVGGFFIERKIKKRGDVILKNDSHIQLAYYSTQTQNSSIPFVELHWFKYRWFRGYYTKSMIDDLQNMSSDFEDVMKAELELVKNVQENISKEIVEKIIKDSKTK